ncbi:MAG: P-loop NTPase [Clostridiales bacterium]|nr:P-loop NTPase [Clostridiales bacterium]
MTENVLLFASSKGGVGKSTVALGLARALAVEGRRVLLADFDFCSPCLDLLCRVENHVLYTVSDLAQEKCSVENALLRPYDTQELYLLPAVQDDLLFANDGDHMSSEQNALLGSAVQKAAEQIQADFVLIDTGAGVSTGLEAAAAIARSAVIVAGHTPASIRAAGRSGQRLQTCGITDMRLVINPFDVQGAGVKKSVRHSMLEIMDGTGIPLLGVVPYDYALTLEQEGHGAAGEAAPALQNIARRLLGQTVPLFSGLPKIRKRKRTLFR